MRRANKYLCLCLAVATTSGCVEGGSVEWGFAFADYRDEGSSVAIHARLLDGGCESEKVLEETWLAPGVMRLQTPVLEPGTYGLMGQASNKQCRLVAEGCVQIIVPDDIHNEMVRVVLSSAGTVPVCDIEHCPGGWCGETTPPDESAPLETDAGTPTSGDHVDAALDAATTEDASFMDDGATMDSDASSMEDAASVGPESDGGASIDASADAA